MNILHLMKDFSSPTQTFIYDLIVGLEAVDGMQNKIVYYNKRYLEKERPFANVYSLKAIGNINLTLIQSIKAILRPKKKIAMDLAKFIINNDIEIIHCHFAWVVWDCLYDTLKILNKNIPIIVTTHGTDITKEAEIEFNREKLIELIGNNNIVFTGSTQYMIELLKKYGIKEDDLYILNNTINNCFLENRKEEYRWSGGVFNVCNNSRLVSWKGHKYLFEAFAKFRKNVWVNSRLTIIGTGKLYEKLNKLCHDLDIDDAVDFVGQVEHLRIPELLKKQHLYVQSSITDAKTNQVETFGVAILEAIAIGLPVIATNTGGIPFVIGEPCTHAMLVNEKDSDGIYTAMKQVFEDKIFTIENSKYANSRVLLFSQKKQIEQCKKIYDILIS